MSTVCVIWNRVVNNLHAKEYTAGLDQSMGGFDKIPVHGVQRRLRGFAK